MRIILGSSSVRHVGIRVLGIRVLGIRVLGIRVLGIRLLATCIFAACLSVTLASVSARAQEVTKRSPIDHGHALFLADGCSECHGTVGQGSRVSGPRLAPQPLPLETFLQVLRHPISEMPPYVAEVLSDTDAGDIHAYLASIAAPTQKAQDIGALNR
jgi:mono/diheme cytochrome c family protein